MNESTTLLIVEDEEAMIAGLEYALTSEGYEVRVARDGEAALRLLSSWAPDLVLLDLMLPKRSGFEVLRSLRRDGRDMPVILLTARGQEADKVRAFDLGADDYVVKPFGLAELLARVRAHIRRLGERRDSQPPCFSIGPYEVDLKSLSSTHAPSGESERLSLREAEMLKLLYRHRGQVVSRALFLDEVWGQDHFPTTRTVDQHVAKLRKKIEQDPKLPRHLLTVFGVGYRLDL
jgi:DNA-binding response OmpR family regulator